MSEVVVKGIIGSVRPRRAAQIIGLVLLVSGVALLASQRERIQRPRRNVIIFIADGLRHDSVNPQDTPALWAVRTQGVHFLDSHALFPTISSSSTRGSEP